MSGSMEGMTKSCQVIEPQLDDFLCAICRDLVYKPVVNVCGHFFCFWCKHEAMSTFRESYCPLCRHAFGHFPRVCELLHGFLLHAFPEEYEMRERETRELETTKCISSPEIKGCWMLGAAKTGSDVCMRDSAAFGAGGADSPLCAPSLCGVSGEGGSSVEEGLSPREREKMGKLVAEDALGQVHLCMDDLCCGQCQQLLYKPMVLNCGHVFCSSPCMAAEATDSEGGVVCCPTCHARQPEGLPGVCKGLKDLLQNAFPEQYAQRETELALRIQASKSELTSTSGQAAATISTPSGREEVECSVASVCPKEAKAKKKTDGSHARMTEVQSAYEHVSALMRELQQLPRGPERQALQSKLDDAQKACAIHVAVGCDSCGAYPIVGQRFRCRDCPEKIGYDLCGKCEGMSAPLPAGRFNQRHTSEHEMEEVLICGAAHPFQHVIEQNPHMSVSDVAQLLHLVESIQHEDTSDSGSDSDVDMESLMQGDQGNGHRQQSEMDMGSMSDDELHGDSFAREMFEYLQIPYSFARPDHGFTPTSPVRELEDARSGGSSDESN